MPEDLVELNLKVAAIAGWTNIEVESTVVEASFA